MYAETFSFDLCFVKREGLDEKWCGSNLRN